MVPVDCQLHCRGIDLSLERPLLMGVLNITPDSFSDGGQYLDPALAVERARQMTAEGADLIDIGGESTRPGSEPVGAREELRRVLPVLKCLVRELAVPISVDTYRPQVAEICLDQGAHLINDITGLGHPQMRRLLAHYQAPGVIMHMLGQPKTMQQNPSYGNVVQEVGEFLNKRAQQALSDGVPQVVVDPGIGFGKRLEDNLALLRHLRSLKDLGYPVLLGASRKSFLGRLTGADLPLDRLEATLAAGAWAVLHGADILRVHEVRAHRRLLQVLEAIQAG